MSWASVVPKELAIQPLPLIVLTGLDTKNNAVHKEIWDGFNVRSNQKFRYKLLDGDYEYPKCKPKRPTEFYIPKGVLKTGWFNKHLFLIPGLVVVFFDLDWDEPNWKEKQMECATKMELVRHSLVDRNTRIILILIQKHPSIPIDGDNSLARERYPALCAACSIKNNYLFLLHAEFLHGYIMKLEEEAFTEPVQTYYTLEIKAIKFKRDSLIKVTHQLLFARLAIKIAFFNEMKGDVFKAIEYYKQAYMSLLDIRIYATNILEVKVVAGIVNYKLCKLFFDIKHPIDAIDQFRKHIDIFRIKEGPVELRFEHSAWLSTQFQLMGELFESAIERGLLNAVQSQHPGFYFHSSATHAIQRRQFHSKLYKEERANISTTDIEQAVPGVVEGMNNLEFYGQRSWRQGLQGMEILDQQKEREGILVLIELESKENLTPFITDLFKLAIKHFKVFNCKRMKQYLSVCMAEEYYHARSYQDALKYLTHLLVLDRINKNFLFSSIYVKVLNDYNNEHWWPIITSIMFNALKCAYLIADATNYCLLATEIIGKNTLLNHQEKASIQENLLRVLHNEAPVAEYHQINTEHHSIEEAARNWDAEINKKSRTDQDSLTIPVHASGMVPFVECKVRFTSPMFNLSQPCEVDVYLRTNCPDVICFDRLSIKFNLAHYNSECVLDKNENAEHGELLTFQPGHVNTIKFNFTLQKQDVGKDLEISSISLELGSIKNKSRVLMLIWKGDCRNALWNEELTKATFSATKFIGKNSIQKESHWDQIRVLSGTSIVARKANIDLKLEHKTPVLVDEIYAIRLTIENKEESVIKNLNLMVDLQPLNDLDKQTDKSCKLWIKNVDKSTGAQHQTCSLSNLEAGQKINELVYVSMNEAKIVNMSLKIKYDCDVVVKKDNEANETDLLGFNAKKQTVVTCSCFLEDIVKLESVNPFRIEFSLMSLQMKPVQSVRLNEPFLLLCDVRNQTPYSVKFLNSYINLKDNIRFKSIKSNDDELLKPTQVQSFLRGETLRPNETATECFCLVVKNDHKEFNFGSAGNEIKLAALGDYLLDWRRTSFSLMIDNENKEDDETEESTAATEALVSASFNLPLDSFNVNSKFLLPEIGVEFFPLLVKAELPAYACLNQNLIIVYTLHNQTESQTLDAECTLDENECFGISGKKQELIQVLPGESAEYKYVIYPLQVGHCRLPHFRLKLNNYGQESPNFESALQNMLPSQLFVFPEPPSAQVESSFFKIQAQ